LRAVKKREILQNELGKLDKEIQSHEQFSPDDWLKIESRYNP